MARLSYYCEIEMRTFDRDARGFVKMVQCGKDAKLYGTISLCPQHFDMAMAQKKARTGG